MEEVSPREAVIDVVSKQFNLIPREVTYESYVVQREDVLELIALLQLLMGGVHVDRAFMHDSRYNEEFPSLRVNENLLVWLSSDSVTGAKTWRFDAYEVGE